MKWRSVHRACAVQVEDQVCVTSMCHKYVGQGHIAHYCNALAGQANAAGQSGSSSSDYIT